MDPVPPVWRHPEYRRGLRDMSGVALGIGAWGLVTGVAMVKSGMGVALAVAMTLFVYAGSAQLAALPLIAHGAPLWVLLATTFCVNLRFVIFSAVWRPYFQSLRFWHRMTIAYFSGDINYIAFMRRFPQPQAMPLQLAYYWGVATANWVAWQGMSLLGIALADAIPTNWGIGFAGTLALIGLIGGLLVDRVTWVAAVVAGCAAMAAMALPFHLDIVVAIAAALAAGALIDHWLPVARPAGAQIDGAGARAGAPGPHR